MALALGLREAWVSSPRWLAGSRHLCRARVGSSMAMCPPAQEAGLVGRKPLPARPPLREGGCGGTGTRYARWAVTPWAAMVSNAAQPGRKGAPWVTWRPSFSSSEGRGGGGCAESRQHPDLCPVPVTAAVVSPRGRLLGGSGRSGDRHVKERAGWAALSVPHPRPWC